ncbi:polar amino acid ABC transporter inner membrane subunit [Fructobacillus pseudoficulneus]|uniref:Polar amino acid ABC transporter inner membrane subunit n=1 Tax=Fructobacillus pseudoficulneus TaxID=220714 RepID=A0A3F3GVA2_9LACO|nr:ABC transporter substrate-binding protein/permease [Fructobacillus pseudoficulneus]GAP03255.1 polar amino acid ABC transporter inner membrane subunit [Fructobacillus pseudoficulneus]SEH43055.1 amino acid ABC transporter substrate-binding protein, PAAT family (TC 3.A.1.3.-)/amino acid ABC transporter membrane protein, PAAT family (TC 3.A.1.3.-) [Fructobacillus pseudoficulneus]
MGKMKMWLKQVLVTITVLVVAGFGMTQVAHADSLQKIKDKGVLTIATSPDYPPYEFQVNQNGSSKDVGMDIDIAKQIAKDLGVKLKIKNMDFSSLLVAVETGKVDMAIGGINPTDERRQSVDFSNVYYNGGQSFVINKADAAKYKKRSDLQGLKIGAQTGTLQYDLAQQKISGATVVGMDKTPNLIFALKTNKVAAVGMEKPVAEAYVKNDKDLKMIDSGYDLDINETGAAVAFAKGNPDLVAAVNKSITKIQKNGWIAGYIKNAGKHMSENTVDTSMLRYWHYFYNGFLNTTLIAIVSVAFGIILGIVLALMKMSKFKLLSWPAISYIEIVRGTPMMVQILLVYFGLGALINLPALTAGIIAVSLNSGAYVAEIIRGGITSLDKGQKEAAKSLGLSQKDAMRFVILPQAFKNIWPALGNEFISVIKESSIVSIIGVTDLVYELNIVRADTYRGIAPIVVVMVIYFLMTFILTRGLNYLEGKMNHD